MKTLADASGGELETQLSEWCGFGLNRVGVRHRMQCAVCHFRRADLAGHTDDVFDSLIAARLLDLVEERLGDFYRVYLSSGEDFPGNRPGVQTRTGTDVGHVYAGLQLARCDDLLRVLDAIAVLAFVLRDNPLDLGVLIVLVDTGAKAFVLGACRVSQRGQDTQYKKLPASSSQPFVHWSVRSRRARKVGITKVGMNRGTLP
jgi:hypothetical protein